MLPVGTKGSLYTHTLHKLNSKESVYQSERCCRLCRAAESKLDVAKELCQENTRLQEKMHHYRQEVRGLEASRHTRTEEVQVLQAQLRYTFVTTIMYPIPRV